MAVLKLVLQLVELALEMLLKVKQLFAVVLSHWLNIEDLILGRVVGLIV